MLPSDFTFQETEEQGVYSHLVDSEEWGCDKVSSYDDGNNGRHEVVEAGNIVPQLGEILVAEKSTRKITRDCDQCNFTTYLKTR